MRTAGGEGRSSDRVRVSQKGKTRVTRSDSRSSREVQWQQEQYLQQQQLQQWQSHHQHLHATDPVLKIAVLKGIYDQILQNVDQMAEPHLPESPAKKNTRFKLLNTLKFLKADRSGSSGGPTFHPPQQQQQYQPQHHGSLPTSSSAGLHPISMMTQ